jgi:hypothetical protein
VYSLSCICARQPSVQHVEGTRLTSTVASTSSTRLCCSAASHRYACFCPSSSLSLLLTVLRLHRLVSSTSADRPPPVTPSSPPPVPPPSSPHTWVSPVPAPATRQHATTWSWSKQSGARRRVGQGEGNEAETGSAVISQQCGVRRRPTTGFTMPSGS